MAKKNRLFTTIHTEGPMLTAELLQRISEGDKSIDGLTPESYHRSDEKLNEVINRSWNALQGAWARFKAERESLPESDSGTKITRERWLLPLFRELDYGRLQPARAFVIDDTSYAVSHIWGQAPIHLVGCGVELDRRKRGVPGASSASPHSLLQIFLNRSDDHLWGFLSNGSKLRILRDSLSLTRQAYVEFDLEAMMESEVYSDFVLLWLLCHQSRLEAQRPADCWLEKWMKAAEEQGIRALDQLREAVKEAVKELGSGFLEHPANMELRDKLHDGRLDPQRYYHQLLRLVYRLLFLFVAEDRDLLFDPEADTKRREGYIDHYSTRRLRRMAEKFTGTRHSDTFIALRLVMRLLSGADDETKAGLLGLAPLGSVLFSDDAVDAVIDCQIANRRLLKAIRALSIIDDKQAKVWRAVDYKNLGPEELGSVYESLLELHPQIDIKARGFDLRTASGSERKTSGSYYTPASLIKALLDSALEPVLAAATRQGEAAILALKICDPACGSGHFLIAAADRMAKALAFVRSGEQEPSPKALQEAKRDIISQCIYGVDINPMAVELCKVSLWLESLAPGKPLSFLDHRIQVGNSLLGATPKLMEGGIPDDAFKPIEGDDKSTVRDLRKQNKKERAGQKGLFDSPPADYSFISDASRLLAEADNNTLDDIRQQEYLFDELARDPETRKARLLADAFCAAFVQEKTAQTGDRPLLTQRIYSLLKRGGPFRGRAALEAETARLAGRYQFFHWHLAFPDVFEVPDNLEDAENEDAGWDGGFDALLGNPPWEHIEIKEKEWFAERNPEIASAPGAKRKRLIADLRETDPYLYRDFAADKRVADGFSHFVRTSGNYPLTGRGRINTYPLFAERTRHLINLRGRIGTIVPSGIATDDTTKFFFQDLMETRSLVSLYDFENRDGLFAGVHRSYKFSLLTMTGSDRQVSQTEFVFFARQVADVEDKGKRFSLTAAEIALLNPNTRTMATFRSRRDAEITKAIYGRVPVLMREKPLQNPQGITFKQGLFNMTSDSHKFHTREDLEARGFTRKGNHFVRGDERWLPLYEAKLMHQFTHRWATYQPNGKTRSLTADELRDPNAVVMPRYWVHQADVLARIDKWQYEWLLASRDITNTTNERTAIMSVFPKVAVSGVNIELIFDSSPAKITAFYANFNSFCFDYAVRQKVGGTHLSQNYLKQLPVIPPHSYTSVLLDFIRPRVLELTYTAWDLRAFARDLGYEGAPFVWDEARRFLLRCELDALYFHLYGIARGDVEYMMDTFPIVRRKDEAAYGEFRTKRVILEMYDAMARLPTMNVPAPKDAGSGYAVPDVSRWQDFHRRGGEGG